MLYTVPVHTERQTQTERQKTHAHRQPMQHYRAFSVKNVCSWEHGTVSPGNENVVAPGVKMSWNFHCQFPKKCNFSLRLWKNYITHEQGILTKISNCSKWQVGSKSHGSGRQKFSNGSCIGSKPPVGSGGQIPQKLKLFRCVHVYCEHFMQTCTLSDCIIQSGLKSMQWNNACTNSFIIITYSSSTCQNWLCWIIEQK